MKTVTKISLGVTATMLAVTAIGGTSMQFSAAIAGDEDQAATAKQAAKAAAAARKAIGKRDHAQAIVAAEQAVALVPRDGAYRALLGSTYLSAGRFTSAAQALGEAVELDPSNGRAALNLALSRIALGDWQGGRETLDAYAAHIAPVDRGLALALSGDPATAIQVLSDAARAPGADAKVRQNLALSLALAGRWLEAKAVAEADLPAGQVNARIMQWAAFARPANASDQVAAILGVVAAADQGRPVQLALHAPAQMAAIAQPVVVNVAEAAPIAPAASTSIAVPAPAARMGVTFAERREIVQAISAHMLDKPVGLVSVGLKVNSAVPARAWTPARGGYVVQLGAFENAGVARDAWGRMAGRFGALGKMTPNGTSFVANGQNFYRLSVGGFARGDADRMCRQVRAKGGRCFVRAQAGDRLANWARGQQLAMR